METFKLKSGDSLKPGDLATVNIKEVTKGQVRFGINAPRSVAVHWLEIYQKIKAENAKK